SIFHNEFSWLSKITVRYRHIVVIGFYHFVINFIRSIGDIGISRFSKLSAVNLKRHNRYNCDRNDRQDLSSHDYYLLRIYLHERNELVLFYKVEMCLIKILCKTSYYG